MGALIVAAIAIGFLLLLVIPYVTRETRVNRVEKVGSTGLPPPGTDIFRQHIELLTGSTFSRTRVEILLNGDGTYDRLFEDVRNAKRSIMWHVFYHRPGRLSDRVRETLIEKAREGLQVFFLHDFFGADGLKGDYVDGMKAAGVHVKVFRPVKWNLLFKMGQRMHIRAVVIDGRLAYTGGMGIDDRWLGDGRSKDSWRDTNVRFEGPAVSGLQAAFIQNWAESTASLLVGEELFEGDDEPSADGERVAVMHTDPSMGSTNAERFFILSIAGARKSIWITNPYVVPDDDFRKLLIEAAQRGVDVRILTPGRNTDQRATYYASRAHLEELMEAGIRYWDYDPTMIHAKTMVVDGVWGYIGTVNLDNRSMILNDEVALMYDSLAIGEQLTTIFLDDLERSTEIDLEEFRRRPQHEKALEQATRLIASLL
ncbi:MAG TPA: cardiolipin synthase [Thermoanaerobaculia bacterium]|nr:cardiolipin synthase [Thermoanaerobaculia bacterium]